MPGILYVVATPIGNLEDVTLRALRILREVSLIAAEDTRHTSKLLQHYSISTPTTSLHEHNERAKTPALIARLVAGDSIALVSDAGTPGVADPGARLVAAAHREGVPVQPVPGASAVLAAVSASGLEGSEFTFVGFPPSRANHRKRWLEGLRDHPYPLVMYEAPHRILRSLADIHEVMGNRRVAIGRELTKAHEILAVRPITAWIQDPPPEKGEFVLVIFLSEEPDAAAAEADPVQLASEFWRLTKSGTIGRREGLRMVARKYGVRAREVFDAVEAHPESGK